MLAQVRSGLAKTPAMCVMAALAGVTPVGAAEPSSTDAGAYSSYIEGAAANDQSGAVANAGDVNGDGRDDLVISRGDQAGESEANRAYVVFGNGTNAPVDLASLGSRGFVINTSGFAGPAVPIGDVNGDNRADIATFNNYATAAGRPHAGRIAIIFGKATTTAVDADALGADGFEIQGSQAEAYAGSPSAISDLNGDGRGEILVTEPQIHRATVLYGKTSTVTIDLSSIGSGGYRIDIPNGTAARYGQGLGDLNGDGLGDAGFSDDNNIWIAFGKADTATVDLGSLGSGGFRVTGTGPTALSAVGDINGDNKADIGICDSTAAQSYVVFGRTATSSVAVGSLGAAGFTLTGTAGGGCPAPVGDLDGDGREDIATQVGNTTAAEDEIVLFGKASSSTVDLASPLDHGFYLKGVGWSYGATASGSFSAQPGIAVGVGAPLTSPFSRENAGGVLILKAPNPAFALPSDLAYSANSAIAPVNPSGIKRSSPIQYSVTPALPAGLTLDAATGTITGTPTIPSPTTSYIVTGTDRLGSHAETVRMRIDSDSFSPTAPVDKQVTGARPTFRWTRASAPDNTEPVSSYTVHIDGQPIGTLAASACEAASCSLEAPTTITDGPHTWEARTTARDGRTRTSATGSFTVVAPPTASLSASAAAMTGEPVSLDASRSTDSNGQIRRFQFDTDGNGSYETDNGTDPRVTVSFPNTGDISVGVRVTDSGGSDSEARTTVHVTPAPPAGELGVTINNGEIATNDPNVVISAVWPRLAETALVSNDGGFGTAGSTRSVTLTSQIPWTLASSGPERLPKIVYVRFRGGQSGRETYTDDIVLDQKPPQVTSASLGPAGASDSTAATNALLNVTGRDDNSGVRQVLVSKSRGGKPIVTKTLAPSNRLGKRKTTTKLRISPRLRTVFVRVTDVAGNRSKWAKVRRR